MIFLSGNELHAVNSTADDNLLIAVQFDSEFFSLLPDLNKCHFQRAKFLEDQKENRELFQQLYRLLVDIVWQYNKRPLGYRYQIAAQFFHVLAILIRQNYFTELPLRTSEQERSIRQINRIVDYINHHYTENLSLKDIAEQEHISYFHLSHIFKEVTGITFRDHLCNVRLHKSTKALCNTKDSILNIALNHGFSTAKSYSMAFQSRYGITPGDYRKHYQEKGGESGDGVAQFTLGNENALLYEAVDSEADLSYIYSLAQANQPAQGIMPTLRERVLVDADIRDHHGELPPVWAKIGSLGRAADLLRQEVQQQVAAAVKAHGYRYLRFHGIFCDDMMIYNRHADGSVVYNWLYVDKIFDFLHALGVRPFLELSFMPSELASGTSTLFFYRANITPPQDWQAWGEMVQALLYHCCDRYGVHEVAQWYVEVWNEPDYHDVFFSGGMSDYFQLYEISCRAVKAVCPSIRVGGPAITHIHYATTPWLEQFLLMCRERQLPCDFLSYHLYADLSSHYSHRGSDIFPKMSTSASISPDLEEKLIAAHHETAGHLGFDHIEHIISEWNISAKPRFRIRDTAFMAPYVIHTALKCCRAVSALTYWCISDLQEELKAPLMPFHGGLGLVNTNGIPKPSFWALHFLSKLDQTIIAQTDGAIITSRNDAYQILLYNLVYLDQVAQKNTDFSSEYEDDLYSLFEDRPTRQYEIALRGISGSYKITHYALDRQCGSAYDYWKQMGGHRSLSEDELQYLRHMATPRLYTEFVSTQHGELQLSVEVPIHGCHLMLLTPQHQTDRRH